MLLSQKKAAGVPELKSEPEEIKYAVDLAFSTHDVMRDVGKEGRFPDSIDAVGFGFHV